MKQWKGIVRYDMSVCWAPDPGTYANSTDQFLVRVGAFLPTVATDAVRSCSVALSEPDYSAYEVGWVEPVDMSGCEFLFWEISYQAEVLGRQFWDR